MRKSMVILGLTCFALTFAACKNAQGKQDTTGNSQVIESEMQDLGQQEPERGQNEEVTLDAVKQARTAQTQEAGKIITASEWQTSYRGIVGEEKDVIFLGKPRTLKAEKAGDCEWSSSDESIATVHDGTVTGWREGLVNITQKQGESVIGEWQFAVTTFNDGRQVDSTYEMDRDEMEALVCGKGGVLEPAFWQQKLNTIQDVITYFQVGGFQYGGDIPTLATAEGDWLWYAPAEMVLLSNLGYSDDLTCAAVYLLQNDFEDWGYVYFMGIGIKHKCWFYEDGTYYYVDFAQLARDLRDGKREESYVPYRANSLEELAAYVEENVNRENVLTVLMISAQGNDFMPPHYFSYMHDSSEIYHTHVVMGMEEKVLEGTTELFSNPDFDYEIIGIPAEEIPEGIPRYGEWEGYRYPYE